MSVINREPIDVSRVITLPEGGTVRLSGALDVEEVEEGGRVGLRPLRLPLQSFGEFPRFESEVLRSAVSAGAGVRISFVALGDGIRLKVRCTRTDFGDEPSQMNDFVACINGRERCVVHPHVDACERITGDGSVCERTVYDTCSILHFTGLGTGSKIVTIWLPQAVIADLIGIASDNGEVPIAAPPLASGLHWLHYGSSISHCHMLKRPTEAWPVLAALEAGLEVTNLGFGGQCMWEPYVAHAIARTKADVITLTAGVNITGERAMNQRMFIPIVHEFLDIIRDAQPDVPIVVFSSILWPGSDDVPGPSGVKFLDGGRMQCYCCGDKGDVAKGALTLAQSRDDLRYIVEQRSNSDSNLYYLDGLSLFGPNDVDAYHLVDGLHPDRELFAEIAHRFGAAVFGESGLVPISSLKES